MALFVSRLVDCGLLGNVGRLMPFYVASGLYGGDTTRCPGSRSGVWGTDHDGLLSPSRLVDGQPWSVLISECQRRPQPEGELATEDQTLIRRCGGDAQPLGLGIVYVSSGDGKRQVADPLAGPDRAGSLPGCGGATDPAPVGRVAGLRRRPRSTGGGRSTVYLTEDGGHSQKRLQSLSSLNG